MTKDDMVIEKPWGSEYLLYSNTFLGIWHLQLDPGQQTSFHAHLRKKTDLIVLEGEALVSFLNSKHFLRAGDKITIHKGVFHSTAALLLGGLQMLEVETPNDKLDIVRLEDPYGRADQPYEERQTSGIRRTIDYDRTKIGQCLLEKIEIRCKGDMHGRRPANLLILTGGMYYQGQVIIGPGSIVDNKILERFAARFDMVPMTLLEIKL